MAYLKITKTLDSIKEEFTQARIQITGLELYTDSIPTQALLLRAWNLLFEAQKEIEKERQ